MTNNDFLAIKPVESLHNIGNITPAKNDQEKKKQQNKQQHVDYENIEDPADLAEDEELQIQLNVESDKHSIDYRA